MGDGLVGAWRGLNRKEEARPWGKIGVPGQQGLRDRGWGFGVWEAVRRGYKLFEEQEGWDGAEVVLAGLTQAEPKRVFGGVRILLVNFGDCGTLKQRRKSRG